MTSVKQSPVIPAVLPSLPALPSLPKTPASTNSTIFKKSYLPEEMSQSNNYTFVPTILRRASIQRSSVSSTSTYYQSSLDDIFDTEEYICDSRRSSTATEASLCPSCSAGLAPETHEHSYQHSSIAESDSFYQYLSGDDEDDEDEIEKQLEYFQFNSSKDSFEDMLEMNLLSQEPFHIFEDPLLAFQQEVDNQSVYSDETEDDEEPFRFSQEEDVEEQESSNTVSPINFLFEESPVEEPSNSYNEEEDDILNSKNIFSQHGFTSNSIIENSQLYLASLNDALKSLSLITSFSSSPSLDTSSSYFDEENEVFSDYEFDRYQYTFDRFSNSEPPSPINQQTLQAPFDFKKTNVLDHSYYDEEEDDELSSPIHKLYYLDLPEVNTQSHLVSSPQSCEESELIHHHRLNIYNEYI